MKSIYTKVKEFKSKYPKCIAFRLNKHARVIEEHLYDGEKVNYVFCGQKSESFISLFKSCVVVVTDQRLVVGQKRIFWGYFFTSVTPDLYNDLKVINNLIWSDINIDTVSEKVYISNIDPKAAIEISKNITKFMMEEKKKYGKKDI